MEQKYYCAVALFGRNSKVRDAYMGINMAETKPENSYEPIIGGYVSKEWFSDMKSAELRCDYYLDMMKLGKEVKPCTN